MHTAVSVFETTYMVVSASTIKELEDTVQSLQRSRWRPKGGIAVTSATQGKDGDCWSETEYLQAMVRR